MANPIAPVALSPSSRRAPRAATARLLGLAAVGLALLAAAPSAQAWTTVRDCSHIVSVYEYVCEYQLNVDVDPNTGQASASFGVCGSEEPTWKANADLHGGGGTVWVPESSDQDNGSSRRESYGSDCQGGGGGSPVNIGVGGH